ncbi:hypothetical protein HF324_29115 [Chitinophaga oryzae]|uniref:Uncharacterized protein n=1 Tax=Chitinophaga oryzae TaxID=2725414 RepID=A0ABX6LNV9_9BACT|nr:hypothetical protein [Chitinophaga oryzae]QJB41688.1 hypothetical protein HF324_29115 [Chitinophaga oryzae]
MLHGSLSFKKHGFKCGISAMISSGGILLLWFETEEHYLVPDTLFLAPLLLAVSFYLTIFGREETMLFFVMVSSFGLPLAFTRFRKLLLSQRV